MEPRSTKRIDAGNGAHHRRGEHAVHVGAGLGYYSAILGHLVGPGGRVTAIEYEADLAARARANLGAHDHIELDRGRRHGGGSSPPT